MPPPSRSVNGSIDLINCLGTRDLFLLKDIEYISRSRRFRPGKSGTNREHCERGGKTGPIPGGEDAGMGVPGESRRGVRGQSMTKDVRTREGFNKFLRRSPLSGVNHTIIGHLGRFLFVFFSSCCTIIERCLQFRVIRERVIRLLRFIINT